MSECVTFSLISNASNGLIVRACLDNREHITARRKRDRIEGCAVCTRKEYALNNKLTAAIELLLSDHPLIYSAEFSHFSFAVGCHLPVCHDMPHPSTDAQLETIRMQEWQHQLAQVEAKLAALPPQIESLVEQQQNKLEIAALKKRGRVIFGTTIHGSITAVVFRSSTHQVL